MKFTILLLYAVFVVSLLSSCESTTIGDFHHQSIGKDLAYESTGEGPSKTVRYVSSTSPVVGEAIRELGSVGRAGAQANAAGSVFNAAQSIGKKALDQ